MSIYNVTQIKFYVAYNSNSVYIIRSETCTAQQSKYCYIASTLCFPYYPGNILLFSKHYKSKLYIETSIYGSVTCPVNCCSPGKNLEIASISHKSNTKIFLMFALHSVYLVFMSLCSISYRREITISMEYGYGVPYSYGFSYITKSYCLFLRNIFIWKLPFGFMKIADVNVRLLRQIESTPNLIHFYDFMSNKIPVCYTIREKCVWFFIPLRFRGMLWKKISCAKNEQCQGTCSDLGSLQIRVLL